jgi:chromosome segregation ATPase
MPITDEAQREIQRLQQALDSETGNRIDLGQRLSVANKRIDQLMAANSAVEGRLAQAKDALAAAEDKAKRFMAGWDKATDRALAAHEQADRLRRVLGECIDWLESRPDYTEGDAATASRARAALGEAP